MTQQSVRTLELLSPARDADTAIAAIDCGADAVYIGGPDHGARASAANSIADIRRVCDYAHRFRVRVYVTFNTLVYEDELEQAAATVRRLWEAGVDALIVQDMSLLRMDIPPIGLHASTQCDARTPERARFLEQCGMSCIVLPREASLDEIRKFAAAVSVPLEAFVHGALCVSYSGDCRASLVNGGRSANRGECAQICRLPYNLTDGDGKTVVTNRHLLSLRDLNRLERLEDMALAGATVFKIEGRLKDADYVRNVTAAYSCALDDICRLHPDKFRRASAGRASAGFVPDVAKAFNRGFTTYALDGTAPIGKDALATLRTPKWVGAPVGKVSKILGSRKFVVRPENPAVALNNGDGLGYFGDDGRYAGFRVNKAEGMVVYTASDVSLRPGTVLYRNSDKAFDDSLKRAVFSRIISVDFELSLCPGGVVLRARDERGCDVRSVLDCPLEASRSNQSEARRRVLQKTGDTIYRVGDIDDRAGNIFIPVSQLTALRRRTLELLDHCAAATYDRPLRRPETSGTVWPEGDSLTFHNNVANSAAAGFYREHGVSEIQPAMEVQPVSGDTEIMCSRYCVRRELGACLKKGGARTLKGPLFLTSPDNRVRKMRLDFDCANCLMHVTAPAD